MAIAWIGRRIYWSYHVNKRYSFLFSSLLAVGLLQGCGDDSSSDQPKDDSNTTPLNDLYVDANFKESQLKKVRPGQEVTLTSDLYGDDVEYHGKVMGFSGGTGSAFALIPAQNATGNWIKVVQRLPVRIALDPKELAEHPLRVGLSMEAKVDLSAK